MNQTNVIQTFNKFFVFAHLLFSLFLGGRNLVQGEFYLSLLGFASVLFLLLPHLFFRAFKKQPIPQLTTLAYLYTTLAFTIGMAMQAYHWAPYYDKIIHTLSGAFFSFLGLLLLATLMSHQEPKGGCLDFPVAALFSTSFSMMIAAVWELYEYALSLFTDMDPQNVLTTGVHDTMQDILVCLVGALLFLIPEYLYFRKGYKDLFMASYEAFTQRKHQQG